MMFFIGNLMFFIGTWRFLSGNLMFFIGNLTFFIMEPVVFCHGTINANLRIPKFLILILILILFERTRMCTASDVWKPARCHSGRKCRESAGFPAFPTWNPFFVLYPADTVTIRIRIKIKINSLAAIIKKTDTFYSLILSKRNDILL